MTPLVMDRSHDDKWGVATATFSADRTYRYALTRTWDSDLPDACFLMLNPSTADHQQMDPTVRRCAGFARSWGAGGLIVLNAFALRSTDPKQLYIHPDPIGPHNDEVIRGHLSSPDLSWVVAAWGHHARKIGGRHRQVAALLGGRALALRVTKDGDPGHPLYVPASAVPVPWAPNPGDVHPAR